MKGAARAQEQNQQPDSIPGMFKPGEFVLPPDTVHAVGGVKALQGVVDATHTPAPKTAVVPRGFKPEMFFANGGLTDDETKGLVFVEILSEGWVVIRERQAHR